MKKLIAIGIAGLILSSCNSSICGKSYIIIVNKTLIRDDFGKFEYEIHSYTPRNLVNTNTFYSDSDFNVGDTIKINKF